MRIGARRSKQSLVSKTLRMVLDCLPHMKARRAEKLFLYWHDRLVCVDMCMDIYMDMRTDMCVGMRRGMCIDACMHICVDMYGHLYGRVKKHVYGLLYRYLC